MHHPDTRAELNDTAATGLEDTKKRGYGPLPCPRCGDPATVSVDLDDLAHFRCQGCDGEFGRPELEAIILAWTPVLAWLDLAPVKE